MATTDYLYPWREGKRGWSREDREGGAEEDEGRWEWPMYGHSPTQALTSHSRAHTHTLHSLRKWLVCFSKNPTGTQGGARGLLQQLHSKLTQLQLVGVGMDTHRWTHNADTCTTVMQSHRKVT